MGYTVDFSIYRAFIPLISVTFMNPPDVSFSRTVIDSAFWRLFFFHSEHAKVLGS